MIDNPIIPGYSSSTGSFSAPRDIPSLDLAFAADKRLAARRGPTPTFSRASGAMQVGATGLIEWAPENLMLNSGNVSFMTRESVPVTISQTGGPLGNYQTLGVNATSGFHFYRYQNITQTADVTSMMWVLAKRGTARYLRIGGGPASSFDWDTLTFSSVSTSHSAGTPISVGDGWYWIPILRNPTQLIDLAPSSSSGTTFNYSEAANVTVEVAAIQVSRSALLQNVTPTYIPTTTAAVFGPRFDHDPVTLASRGLLIEEQRTNLSVQSNAFSSTPWGENSGTVTISQNQTGPDGVTNSAWTFTDDSAANIEGRYQSVSLVSGATYSISVYVKKTIGIPASFPALTFARGGSGSGGGVLNTTTGTITPVTSYGGLANISATVNSINAGDYWRISAVFTSTATGSWDLAVIPAFNTSGNGVSDVTATGSAVFFGHQLELGSFPTSYIPTTTTALTRSADVCSITGAAFSSFYNQSEGTVFANHFYSLNLGGRPFHIGDGSVATNIAEVFNGSGPASIIFSSGSQQYARSVSATNGTMVKTSLAFAPSNAMLCVNGTLATSGGGLMPVGVDRIIIGNRPDGARNLNGHIASIQYFRKRLSDAKLQALTTP